MFEYFKSWFWKDKPQPVAEKKNTKAKSFIERTRITRSQFERIITLREDGWTYPAISKVTDLSCRTCGNVYKYREDYDRVIRERDAAK